MHLFRSRGNRRRRYTRVVLPKILTRVREAVKIYGCTATGFCEGRRRWAPKVLMVCEKAWSKLLHQFVGDAIFWEIPCQKKKKKNIESVEQTDSDLLFFFFCVYVQGLINQSYTHPPPSKKKKCKSLAQPHTDCLLIFLWYGAHDVGEMKHTPLCHAEETIWLSRASKRAKKGKMGVSSRPGVGLLDYREKAWKSLINVNGFMG